MTKKQSYTIIFYMNAHPLKSPCKILGENQIEVSLYTCSFTTKKVYPHKHLFYEINLCLDGTFNNIINGTDCPFAKRRCAILRPSDVHYFTSDSSKQFYRHQDIYITKEKMKECCDFLSPDLFNEINNSAQPVCLTLSNKDFEYITEELEVFAKKIDYDSKFLDCVHKIIIVKILLSYVKSLTINNRNDFPPWLTNLLDKMDDIGFLTKPEPQIASELEYTTSHFSREFKKYVHMTYIKYVNIRKINYAAKLILGTDKPILEISEELGYSSPSPFIVHFKEVFNCSPSQYRKTLKHV